MFFSLLFLIHLSLDVRCGKDDWPMMAGFQSEYYDDYDDSRCVYSTRISMFPFYRTDFCYCYVNITSTEEFCEKYVADSPEMTIKRYGSAADCEGNQNEVSSRLFFGKSCGENVCCRWGYGNTSFVPFVPFNIKWSSTNFQDFTDEHAWDFEFYYAAAYYETDDCKGDPISAVLSVSSAFWPDNPCRDTGEFVELGKDCVPYELELDPAVGLRDLTRKSKIYGCRGFDDSTHLPWKGFSGPWFVWGIPVIVISIALALFGLACVAIAVVIWGGVRRQKRQEKHDAKKEMEQKKRRAEGEKEREWEQADFQT